MKAFINSSKKKPADELHNMPSLSKSAKSCDMPKNNQSLKIAIPQTSQKDKIARIKERLDTPIPNQASTDTTPKHANLLFKITETSPQQPSSRTSAPSSMSNVSGALYAQHNSPHQNLFNSDSVLHSNEYIAEPENVYPYNLEYKNLDKFVKRGVKIGGGGFADVYVGHVSDHGQLKPTWPDSVVALKFVKVNPDRAEDYELMLKLFTNEALLMNKAQVSKFTLPLYGLNQERLIMVTPVMDGTLHEAIHGCRKRGVKLSMRSILKTGHDLLCGIAHLHSLQIAHLDIKPANILIKREPLTPELRRRSATMCFGWTGELDFENKKKADTPLLLYDENFAYRIYITDFGMAKPLPGIPSDALQQRLALKYRANSAPSSPTTQRRLSLKAEALSGTEMQESEMRPSSGGSPDTSSPTFSAMQSLFPVTDGITLLYAPPEAIVRFNKSMSPTKEMKQLASYLQHLQAGTLRKISPGNSLTKGAASFISRVVASQDIYAFSMVLYEMLTASKPFTGEERDKLPAKIVYKSFRPNTDLLKTRPELFIYESGYSQLVPLSKSSYSAKNSSRERSKTEDASLNVPKKGAHPQVAQNLDLVHILKRCWASDPICRPLSDHLLEEWQGIRPSPPKI